MTALRNIYKSLKDTVMSLNKHNIAVFCAFLCLSAVLWLAMTVNVEMQKDVRCRLRITNVPDSVVAVTPPPADLNVSLRGAGTAMPWFGFGGSPSIDIDYAAYQRDGILSLHGAELRNIVARAFAHDVTITMINPDSLKLEFTSRPPVKLPLQVDSRITTMPNCVLTGPVKAGVDSVLVYSRKPLPAGMRSVSTQTVQLTDVSKSTVVRVPVAVPAGCRALPDSVDVRLNVEPMISTAVNVPVTAVNVPAGVRLILLPNTVRVNYMLPMSRYNARREVQFKVSADYRSITPGSRHVKVNVHDDNGAYINVYTSTDSVEYLIERD